MGLLDDAARRLTDEANQREQLARQEAGDRAARIAEGQQLAEDFIQRARAAGLKPTFELKTTVLESVPEPSYNYNAVTKEKSGRSGRYEWSTPHVVATKHFAWCWQLGSAQGQSSDTYFLSIDGRRYIEEHSLRLVREEGDLASRSGRRKARRELQRAWVEADVHASHELATTYWVGQSDFVSREPLAEAMVKYLQRGGPRK